MKRRSKYQFAGTDPSLYSLENVYNAVNSYYDRQVQMEEEISPEVPMNQDNIYSDDYQDLLDRYTALEERLSEIERSRPDSYVNSYNDDFLNFLFSDDDTRPINFDENIAPAPTQPSQYGLTPETQSLVDELQQRTGELTVTSGRRSQEENVRVKGSPKSYHLSGQAVDFRPNEKLNAFFESQEGRDYLKSKGYEVIDERNRPGHGAHWHIEPKKYRFGGIPVANTPDELYSGLNGSDYDEMILNLPPQYNIIRGLDSGRPVVVTDELGNSNTLHGNEDVTEAYGRIYERKLQLGGRTFKSQEEIDRANQFARSLLKRQNASVYDVSNTVAARKIGDPVPEFVYTNGLPTTPTPRATTLPFGVSINDVMNTSEGYGYLHPQHGNFVKVDPTSVYAFYGQKSNLAKL